MSLFDRRRFVSTSAAAAVLLTPGVRAVAAMAGIGPVLTIHSVAALAHIPADFTGLSYESSQLIHPSFFSGENTRLVSFFRTLGETGVLRIGGNMSEFTTFSAIDPPLAQVDNDGVEGPDPGRGTDLTFTITPRAIKNLNTFLEATNWKLIYGLNLASGTAEMAADEAACVAKLCGPRLLAFQFGNEPDLFKHNKDVKNRWTYAEFIAKWQTFEKAVRAKLPNAVLAGPDTSFKPDWVGNFAKDTKGDTTLITAHYYAEGPPTNPKMTIEYLLNQQEKFEAHIISAVVLARQNNLPYRMSEGNTCYNAGKKGVSDTFASALWAGDFLAQIAKVGGTGVNLHGGGNGLYTPIAGGQKDGFTARPVYYGMLMARPLEGATMLNSDLNLAGMNVSAYAMQKKGKMTVLAFNKGATPTTLTIATAAGRLTGNAAVLRLVAPAIDATSGVTLGGAAVTGDGSWTPLAPEMLKAGADGMMRVALPAYSGAAIELS